MRSHGTSFTTRLLGGAFFALAACGAAAVEVGDSFESVVAELGRPQSEATIRGTRQLFYAGGVIELRDDKVTYVDPGFPQRALRRTNAAAYEAAQKAKGLVLYEGRWVHPRERQALEERKAAVARRQTQAAAPPQAAAAGHHERVRDIRGGGQRIDLASVLVPGKVTVVDFYADWCGPCLSLSPHLNELAASHPDIHVVKIDIVNWDSEVVRQHNIRSVPNVRVFNRAGKPVGSPTSDLKKIQENARKART